MPNTREKLVRLLEGAKNSREIFCTARLYCSELIADHLISNGVTLDNQVASSKWIPVSDRLPESSQRVIVCRKGGKVEQGVFLGVNGWWKVYGTNTKSVTHWMPLPEPPKEV